MINNDYTEKLISKVENYIFENNELLSKKCIDEKLLYNLGFQVAFTQLSNYCIEKNLVMVCKEDNGTKYLELHKKD